MNVERLLAECGVHGVQVLIVDGQIRARGAGDALAQYTPILRAHKSELLAYLAKKTEAETARQIREFMELDGMALTDAKRLAAVSVPNRSAVDWLEMIRALDDLIGRYCAAYRMDDIAQAKIRAARCCQPLATIPETLRWFQRELANVKA